MTEQEITKLRDANKKYRGACETLIAWADYGGDAVEMLDDAVALAKEAVETASEA